MGSVKPRFMFRLSFGNDIYNHKGGLFDKGFIDNRTASFDKLRAHVQEFRKIGVISGVNQISTCLLMINHLTIKS